MFISHFLLGVVLVSTFAHAGQVELFYPDSPADLPGDSLLEVKDGSVLFLKISGMEPKSVNFLGKKLLTFPLEEKSSYGALVAIPPETAPGPLKVEVHFKETKQTSQVKEFKVVAKDYPTEQLKVAPGKGAPKKKDLPRIIAEKKEVGKIYKTLSTPRMWKGPLLRPLESDLTSVFGNRRMFNGVTQSFHSGVDFRAPEGTPVVSAAPGTVMLAKDLFFSGVTVILDHGYGLFTIYAHLSDVKVKPGDKVGIKTLLGLSGKTGRVSGPHLHWGAVVSSSSGAIKVDPMDLIADTISKRGF
jgi:murein DD-endopeptidase MepM/ murein hydrolase activator NlpD